jgi:hypothetical protein
LGVVFIVNGASKGACGPDACLRTVSGQPYCTEADGLAVLCLSSALAHAVLWRMDCWACPWPGYGADMTVSGQVVARRLPVFGQVNAGKAATLASMGAEVDRVRAGVWARFSGAKKAALSKRQIRDRMKAEHASADFGVPQRLWRATVEDTVDKIRAWQQAVIAKRVCSTRPRHRKLIAVEGIEAGVSEVFTDICGRRYGAGQYEQIAARAERDRARGRARTKLRAVRDPHLARVIRDRVTDSQISRYTPKREVKRILTRRAGSVENCPTTTQATTTPGGGCERNNKLPKRLTTRKK